MADYGNQLLIQKGRFNRMSNLTEMGQKAVAAKYDLQKTGTEKKNLALCEIAAALRNNSSDLIAANQIDLAAGKEKQMHQGLLDRLMLDEKRIDAMAAGLEQVALLPDPVGEELEHFVRPNGLQITKVRVPIGVIGIIYESRPNVTADAFSLCFKSGNAVILKGGSDAIHSNVVITSIIRNTLVSCGINPDVLQLIEDTDRSIVQKFMKMNEYVDVLIPRGSAGLIRNVVENSTIPVIETGTGNCHIYVDEQADFEKAIPIIINAKTQRIGVCNAAESLVIHEEISDVFLPLLAKEMHAHHVEMRGDADTRKILPDVIPATQEDFGKEYLDYIISIKTVKSLDEAIEHINQYNTGHSETIITENQEHADRFLHEIDAACVYVNASTRFTDGFEFGFGAEIGISTQKLHARGPMGLEALTSYKYIIYGNGQIRP